MAKLTSKFRGKKKDKEDPVVQGVWFDEVNKMNCFVCGHPAEAHSQVRDKINWCSGPDTTTVDCGRCYQDKVFDLNAKLDPNNMPQQSAPKPSPIFSYYTMDAAEYAKIQKTIMHQFSGLPSGNIIGSFPSVQAPEDLPDTIDVKGSLSAKEIEIDQKNDEIMALQDEMEELYAENNKMRAGLKEINDLIRTLHPTDGNETPFDAGAIEAMRTVSDILNKNGLNYE